MVRLGAWVVVLLLSLMTLSGCHREERKTEAEEQVAAVTVRAEPAERRAVVETVDGLGKCEALVERLVTLTPAVEGQVEKICVKQGDGVKAGQPIVELNMAGARADLAEKEATLDSLQASLRLLKSTPRPEERKPTELAVDQAKVAVQRAQATVDRLRPLRERKEVPESQMFEAEQGLIQAKLQRQTAEAQLTALILGPRAEAVAEAQAKIDSAEATLAAAKVRLDLHTIRTPIDGVVDNLNCHLGQTVAAGTSIGQVIDLGEIYAVAWLPASAARQVRVGQSATIVLATSPHAVTAATKAEANETISGKVESIGQLMDSQSGNLPVRVLVDNSAGRLVAGETAEVTITVQERPDVLVVPAEAIFDLGDGPIVYVVRDGKTATLKPDAIVNHKDGVEISGTDLKSGELVITEGAFNVPDGTVVAVEASKEAEKKDEHAADAAEAKQPQAEAKEPSPEASP